MPDRSPYSRDPYPIDVAGLHLTMEYRPAAYWVPLLTSGRFLTLLQGTLRGGQFELSRALAAGRVTPKSLHEALYGVICEAGGYGRWWEVVRLCVLSEGREGAGSLALKGVDPERVSLAQWCHSVYVLYTQGGKPEDVFKFEAQLSTPPPGFEDAWDDGSDFDMMVQAARSLPGMG